MAELVSFFSGPMDGKDTTLVQSEISQQLLRWITATQTSMSPIRMKPTDFGFLEGLS